MFLGSNVFLWCGWTVWPAVAVVGIIIRAKFFLGITLVGCVQVGDNFFRLCTNFLVLVHSLSTHFLLKHCSRTIFV
ncbi:MAG: hypothetical protein A2261_04145 [Candidatus Magasanikbacteria bacterium RIFOXYA2_FULL_44_8]|uniref:Uncharacterized protein n=1 Tax=Candidatus Magasanikbacteria bacterium RIFOXYA2_FULL_44_8 TaxID=1798696 RepID=A0A1F6NIK4_9BACT|nr:MAG: hypothetical protein A2261_04145 [Candidatus Magasanikbacteria bacterium RIFOXYA2_FULL_44_8]